MACVFMTEILLSAGWCDDQCLASFYLKPIQELSISYTETVPWGRKKQELKCVLSFVMVATKRTLLYVHIESYKVFENTLLKAEQLL